MSIHQWQSAPHPSPLPARGEGTGGRGMSLLPVRTGRRCRQADEGRTLENGLS
ncbi:hypothetical protein SS05631_c39670 [Sinorhizobium sp. CCBAU 05631]|nr:hypothetical protein SS05631_c39670 [Sinorhizobium sp. CCBAU 05631]